MLLRSKEEEDRVKNTIQTYKIVKYGGHKTTRREHDYKYSSTFEGMERREANTPINLRNTRKMLMFKNQVVISEFYLLDP